jgi:Uma2 family endonuclease
MMHAQTLPHYTYADYKLWEGNWELIGGIPYAMIPAPNLRHQRVTAKISHMLDDLLAACPACESLLAVDWKIAEDTVVQPDNLVICHQPQHSGYLEQAPELVFEILSPSTAYKDRHAKYALYEQAGVRYYVLVDAEAKTLRVYKFVAKQYQDMGGVHKETVEFEFDNCRIDFSCGALWS